MRQLKIFSGCSINCDKIISRFAYGSAEKWQLTLLGGREVFNKPRNCGDIRAAKISKTAQVPNTIGPTKRFCAGGAVKSLRWQLGCGCAGFINDFQNIIGCALSDQHLSRGQPGKLRPQSHRRAGTVAYISGRNIHPGEAALVAHLNKSGQKVTFTRVEQRVFGQGAWGDQPNHAAFHNRFRAALLRLLWIFQLFADRNTKPFSNEVEQIALRRMHGHTAHGNIRTLMLAAFR